MKVLLCYSYRVVVLIGRGATLGRQRVESDPGHLGHPFLFLLATRPTMTIDMLADLARSDGHFRPFNLLLRLSIIPDYVWVLNVSFFHLLYFTFQR